jgi:hypothetical protein
MSGSLNGSKNIVGSKNRYTDKSKTKTKTETTNIFLGSHPSAALRVPNHELFAGLIRSVHGTFGGRQAELGIVAEWVSSVPAGYLLLTAPAGFGKTSICAELAGSDAGIARHFFTPTLAPSLDRTWFLQNIVEQVAAWHGNSDVIPTDANDLQVLFESFMQRDVAPPRLLVIDALDECPWDIRPFVSPLLAAGVRIIASVRDVGTDMPARYRFPDQQTRQVRLQGFTREDVTAVVRAAGGGATAIADNSTAIDKIIAVASLEDVTQGSDPLYVSLLASDIAAGRLSPAEIETEPPRLAKYLDRWLDDLNTATADAQAVRDTLGVLAVARSPLGIDELRTIVPRLADIGSTRESELALGVADRFLKRDEERRYSFGHLRFQAHFREHGALGPAMSQLLTYCSVWDVPGGEYSLRHFADHLVDARDIGGLMELSRDERYHEAQRDRLPDEPELAFRPTQLATQELLGAGRAQESAEFIVLEADRRYAARRTLPTEVLAQAGVNAALRAAEMHPPEASLVFQLLIAWQTALSGDVPTAGRILETISTTGLQPSGFLGDLTSFILARMILHHGIPSANLANSLTESSRPATFAGLIADGLDPAITARQLSSGYSYGLGSEPWTLARVDGPIERAPRATIEQTLPILREIGRGDSRIGDLATLIAIRSGLPIDRASNPELSAGIVGIALLHGLIVTGAPTVETTLTELVESSTEATEAVELAQTLWDVDRRDDALDVCRRAIERDVDQTELLRLLLKSLPMFRHVVRSIGDRLNLSEVSDEYLVAWVSAVYPPARPEVRRRLLESRASALRDEEAVDATDVAIALIVAGFPRDAFETTNLLGDDYTSSQVIEAAISVATSTRDVQQVLDRVPDLGDLYFQLDSVVARLLELGDVDAAAAAIARSPDWTRRTLNARVGAALARLGAESEAIGVFARCIVGDRARAEIWSRQPTMVDGRSLQRAAARLRSTFAATVLASTQRIRFFVRSASAKASRVSRLASLALRGDFGAVRGAIRHSNPRKTPGDLLSAARYSANPSSGQRLRRRAISDLGKSLTAETSSSLNDAGAIMELGRLDASGELNALLLPLTPAVHQRVTGLLVNSRLDRGDVAGALEAWPYHPAGHWSTSYLESTIRILSSAYHDGDLDIDAVNSESSEGGHQLTAAAMWLLRVGRPLEIARILEPLPPSDRTRHGEEIARLAISSRLRDSAPNEFDTATLMDVLDTAGVKVPTYVRSQVVHDRVSAGEWDGAMRHLTRIREPLERGQLAEMLARTALSERNMDRLGALLPLVRSVESIAIGLAWMESWPALAKVLSGRTLNPSEAARLARAIHDGDPNGRPIVRRAIAKLPARH